MPSTRWIEHPAALDVAEKAGAEPDAAMRALDQAGNVGQHHLLLADADHAQRRPQRGERIIGDLRAGAARRRRGTSTCRRSAGRPDRRRRAASAAGRCENSSPGRPGSARRGARLVEDLNAGIAEAAAAAAGDHRPLPGASRSASRVSAVLAEHLGADRHPQHDVGAVARRCGSGLRRCRRACALKWRR